MNPAIFDPPAPARREPVSPAGQRRYHPPVCRPLGDLRRVTLKTGVGRDVQGDTRTRE